ncbi:MAG: polyprenyl synthetase family protein [Chloroflexi bacterium]|nr:polyprenyl synthetase family protein [Chloroflexota bacterium]
MDLQSLSSRYQPELDRALISMVGNSSLPMYHMMRYHMGWVDASGEPRQKVGGKRLRPGLCLLACESVGGEWRKALPAAAALELLHNFTLVHDDIEDGDRERQGVPTVWHVWGEAQGINTGDAMHVLARLALLSLNGNGVPPEKVLRAARMLDETCLRLCEGQHLDISYEGREDVGIEEYITMIEGKTAALFACSLELGAILGADDGAVVEGLGRFGRNLGLAFQVQDDALGIWGEAKVTGKSAASDILKKKKTFPVIHALRNAEEGLRRELLRIYAQENVRMSDIADVLHILESVDARRITTEAAERYIQQALFELGRTNLSSEARNDLTSLAESLMGRQY